MKQYLFRHIYRSQCYVYCVVYVLRTLVDLSFDHSFILYVDENSSNVSLCSMKINEHFMLAHVMRIFMIIIVIYAFYACMLFFLSFRFVCVFIVFGMLFLLLVLFGCSDFFFVCFAFFFCSNGMSFIVERHLVCVPKTCLFNWYVIFSSFGKKSTPWQSKEFYASSIAVTFRLVFVCIFFFYFHCYLKLVSSEFSNECDFCHKFSEKYSHFKENPLIY